jgi:quinol monooxygenase YgiN
VKRLPLLLVLGAVLMLSAPFVPADDKAKKDDKPAPDIMTRLKDAGVGEKPFTLIVRFKIKPGNEKKMEEEARRVSKASRAEKGCLAYELHRDLENKGEYVLFERWKGTSALEAHFKEEHTKAILALLGEVAAGPPEVKLLAPVESEK